MNSRRKNGSERNQEGNYKKESLPAGLPAVTKVKGWQAGVYTFIAWLMYMIKKPAVTITCPTQKRDVANPQQ